jgi:ATP-dependent RNA helicase DHX37/DHR1
MREGNATNGSTKKIMSEESNIVVRVTRAPEIDEVRSSLPAVMTEQEIVDAVRNNDFSLVCGGTGCGKSTQVPQFLYESGFTVGAHKGKLIAVTQPRRVAAVSVSTRVGVELNDPDLVGYQVRYDKQICGSKMAIKFMTDGILLREIQDNIRLPQYSVVIIDEAHERSINCDMLLGLLSGSIRARRAMGDPLRVVVMSATLKMTDFTGNKLLFPNGHTGSGIVNIDSKMFPVTVHYERRTEEEYLPLITAKVRKIHTTLPAGTILVFVTGKKEVRELCEEFSGERKQRREDDIEDDDQHDDPSDRGFVAVDDASPDHSLKRAKLAEDFTLGDEKGLVEELVFDAKSGDVKPSSKESSSSSSCAMFTGGGPGSSLRVFALHAQMTSERQFEVFEAHKNFPNDRIVVVSTNVAETSLTIPNVRYVIDCGREKRREYNASGVSRFAVRFTSQASANQRAGRCGRVGPGHVYRLYSPNVFGEHMPEFPSPEIETNPLDSAILFLKSMGVGDVTHLPWPTPPPELHVQTATRRLRAIGCLDSSDKVTARGKRVSDFPVSPRLAVALLLAGEVSAKEKNSVWIMTCACVASLSTDTGGDSSAEFQKTREILIRDFDDDIHASVVWLSEWMGIAGIEERTVFCAERSLNPKGMDEVIALFHQLVGGVDRKAAQQILHACIHAKNIRKIVNQFILVGFVDQVAIRDQAGGRVYRAAGNSKLVEIHRHSALSRRRPEWVGFVEMVQASGEFSDKRTMKMCFEIDVEFFATIESPLIDLSKQHPLMKPTKVGDRMFKYVIPRYLPLSINIADCVPVEMSST